MIRITNNNKQSNFYVLKEIEHGDTICVVDKDILPVSKFIKEYNGVENNWIILQKSNISVKKKIYIVNIPANLKISNRKIYLGKLIKLIE